MTTKKDEVEKLEKIQHEVNTLRVENRLMTQYEKIHFSDDETTIKTHMKSDSSLLTAEQKLIVVTSALEELNNKRKEHHTSEKLIDTLLTVIGETDCRISDLKRDAFDFKKEVVTGVENRKIAAIRYLETKISQREGIIAKLHLDSHSFTMQKKKIKEQLKQKDEAGGVPHYIDYHQLQIENKQVNEKIKQKNMELMKLKATTGKACDTLNELKNQLCAIGEEENSLSNGMVFSERSAKIKDGIEKMKEEVKLEQNALLVLNETAKNTSYENQIQITDYIEEKAKMYELRDAIKCWERKVEIAETNLKRSKAVS